MSDLNTLLDQFDQENDAARQSALSRSALIAHNTNPDRYAANRQQARQQGIPAAFADPATGPANMDAANGLIDTFRQLPAAAPRTADFLHDPERAKVAHDDTGILSGLERAFKGAGARLAQGVNLGLGSIMKTLTGTPGMYQSGAEYWDRVAKDQGMTGLAGDVYQGIGSAPAGIAEFMANIPYAVLKGGREGYAQGGVTGMVTGALTEAVKRYGIGKVFHGIEQSGMTPLAKSLTMAGTMGAQTAAEGGSPQDIISSTIVGMALVPPKGQTKGDVVRRQLVKQGVEPKIAREIGAHVDGLANTGPVALPEAPGPEAGDNIGNYLNRGGAGGRLDAREQRVADLNAAFAENSTLDRDAYLEALRNQQDPRLAELMAAGRTRPFDLGPEGELQTPYRPDFVMQGRTPDEVLPPAERAATRDITDAERPVAGLLPRLDPETLTMLQKLQESGAEPDTIALVTSSPHSFANVTTLLNLVDTARTSKLKARSPEDFRDFVRHADDTGLTVTMPLEVMDDILKQSGKPATELLDQPETYLQARMEGAESVTVPFSDIANLADHITPEHVVEMGLGDVPSVAELQRQRQIYEYALREVQQGEAGTRIFTEGDAGEGGTLHVVGQPSTFPEWFRNKGWTKAEVVTAFQKALSGKKLTAKQQSYLDAAMAWHREELARQKNRLGGIDETYHDFYNEEVLGELQGVTDPEALADAMNFFDDLARRYDNDRRTETEPQGETGRAAAEAADSNLQAGEEGYSGEDIIFEPGERYGIGSARRELTPPGRYEQLSLFSSEERVAAEREYFYGYANDFSTFQDRLRIPDYLQRDIERNGHFRMEEYGIPLTAEEAVQARELGATVRSMPVGGDVAPIELKYPYLLEVTKERLYGVTLPEVKATEKTAAQPALHLYAQPALTEAERDFYLDMQEKAGKEERYRNPFQQSETTPFYSGLPVPHALTWLKNIKPIRETLDWLTSILNLPSQMTSESREAFGKMRGMRNQYSDKLAAMLHEAEQSPDLKTAITKFIAGTDHLEKVFDRRSKDENATFFDKLRENRLDEMTPDEQKVLAIGMQLDQEFAQLVRMVDPDFPLRENHGMMTLHWVKDAADRETPLGHFSARLEGSKGFTKKFSGRTATDIMGAGWDAELNPVKVLKASLSDHIKYVSGGLYLNEGMDSGRFIYVPRGEEAPTGMARIPDIAGKVYKRILYPEPKVNNEYVDAAIHDGLMQVADNLGVPHSRVENAGRGALGYYRTLHKDVTTQANTDLSVLAHEIGHAIDLMDNAPGGRQQKLWTAIVDEAKGVGARGTETKTANQQARATIKNELRAIADLMGDRGGKGYTRKRVEQIAQMVELYIHAPDLMREEAPHVYAAFDAYVRQDPRLAPMAGLRPGAKLKGLSNEITIPSPVYAKFFAVKDSEGNTVAKFPQRDQAHGYALDNGYLREDGAPAVRVQIGKPVAVEAGHWYGPKAEMLALQRYLESDPLRRNPVIRGLLEAKGLFTSAELYGLFHFSNIAEEGIRAKSADVLRSALAGDLSGARDNMRAASGYGMLDIANRMLKDPNFASDPVVVAKLQRAGMTPEQFQTVVNDLYHGGLKLHSDDLRAQKGALSAMLDRGSEKFPLLEGVRIGRDALMAVTNTLFTKFVPDLKLAAAISALRTNERLYADRLASREITREDLVRQTVNSIENRFGELNYENLMLPKAFKTALQLVFRAPGWNIGTWREIPNAVRLQAKELQRSLDHGEKPLMTQEFSWLVSTVALHVAEAALIGYAASWATGNKDLEPKEWTDLIFPKIAAMTKIVPPGYLKEVFSMYHDMQQAPFFIPLNYLQSKLTGYWGRMAEIFRNKDYYGQRVRDPEAPAWEQAASVAGHMVPTPLFVRSIMAEKEQEAANAVTGVASFLGFSKAPSWVEKSAAENLIGDLQRGSRGEEALAPEEFQMKKAKAGIIRHLRNGGTFSDLPQNLQEQLGRMTDRQIKQIDADAALTPLQAAFKHLIDPTLEKSLKVWKKATDQEREELRDIYDTRVNRYLMEHQDRLPEEEIARLNTRMMAAELRK